MNSDKLPHRDGRQLLLELCIKDGSVIDISVSRKILASVAEVHAAPGLPWKPPPRHESLMENILIAAAQ